MNSYVYSAYDRYGGKIDGNIKANSLDAAKQELQKQKLVIVSIKAESSGLQLNFLPTSNKLSFDELEFITSELSILLKNGIKIDRSLEILYRNKKNLAAAKVLNSLYKAVKSGESLSDAMEREGDNFDALYVNLVRMGEASGTLPIVFERLADDLKFRSELRKKIVQSLTYPVVIFAVCILCVLFIFNYIVPQMSGLFEGLNEIPSYTQFLLSLSSWMQNYQWYLFIGLAMSGFALVSGIKKGYLKSRLDSILLKTPLKGAVLIVERIRFNSALAMMLEAGISIDKALELSAGSVKNADIRQGLLSARESVKKGESLTSSLSRSPVYPDFFQSLLEVGEESGKLQPVFDEITVRSRSDFENWTNSMTSILEPLLILTMGGIVGSVVVTMLLSILSVNDVGF